MIIFVRKDGQPDKKGRDMVPTIKLEDIPSTDDYVGLMIAGGYSPGYLEKSPKALALTREFMTKSKPVSAICHGPRLVAQAGMLSNRVTASWMGLADELPDAWVNGEVGVYRDEAVVVDGNLITARYPNDTTAFTQEFMRHMAKQGGLPMPEKQARVVVVMPDLSGHFQYVSGKTLNVLGHETQWIRSEKELAKYVDQPAEERMQPDLVLVFPGEKSAALQQSDSWAKLPQVPQVVLAEADYLDQLRQAGKLTQEHGRAIPAPTKPVYTAVIALADGFDDRVVANMQAVLPALGYQVTTVADRSGWITGNEGLRVKAEAT